MINFFIYTGIVLATAVVNAFIDAYLIKKYWGLIVSLNHWSRTLIRFCIFVVAIVCLLPLKWYTGFIAGFYAMFLFGIVFDLLLNYLRDLPWYYKGTSAITDKAMHQFTYIDEVVGYYELGIKITGTLIFGIWTLLI